MLQTRAFLFSMRLWRQIKRDLPLRICKTEPWPGDLPFISIVIPCYNQGHYLDEAVGSLLSQTWQNLEIIVVNDASDDLETIGILKNYHRPKTRVLNLTQNMGLPAARNAGVKEARGKYICCLDADDKLQATYLEKALAVMEVNAGISFVWPWTQVFGDEDRVWYAPQFDPHQMLFNNQAHPPAVFKRMAWQQTGGYCEKMREGFEDWEFWVRLTGSGYRGYRISEKLLHYRRVGHGFALRAAEKKEELFAQIKANNPALYVNPKAAIDEVIQGYSDIYSPAPFLNMASPGHYLKMESEPGMVVSNLDSRLTLQFLGTYPAESALIWIAKQPLDEWAIDALYQRTPYVYVLPNFLPHYAHFEFIQHLLKVWGVRSLQKLG